MPSQTSKPSPKAPASETRRSSPREPSRGFAVALLFLKIIAILWGFLATMLCLMALVGALTDNGYARVLVALVVTIAVPLAIADKLLPEDDPTRGKGIVTDVLSLFLVGFSLAFLGAARFTGGLLVREGDRLASEGYAPLARVAYLLGGVSPQFETPAPEPTTNPTADAGAEADAATEAAADAGAAADAAAEADAATDAGAAADAGSKENPPDGGALGKAEKTPAELFRDLSPSVVTIFVKKGEQQGGGTGFLIDDEQGLVVTNHHVIDRAGHARIKFQNGATFEDIEVLLDNAEVDLALLQIELNKPAESGAAPAEAKSLPLGDSDKIVVGERAIAIGNPLGLEHTLTDGLVSARRLHEGKAWIQISVPISPGNSGGPLINMRGEVIGINTAQFGGPFAGAQNLNLAVPVNELKRLLKPTYASRHKLGDPSSSSSQW